ncbi:hypothetical protein [Magnetospirillum aberrantis]|uniref:Uncharacterized protein n=1 Tax=Magnetospirillum aberrantis SpK TaxID=908842 RepID=A0A7C9UW74_9PROT|nr:hypothetical protein [Magnetospirillum aberrantis]NFV82107.1 hypothetical protein [Magnetospirillum aberrantis SpK]
MIEQHNTSIPTGSELRADALARLAQARTVLNVLLYDGEYVDKFERLAHEEVVNLIWTAVTLLEQSEDFLGKIKYASAH